MNLKAIVTGVGLGTALALVNYPANANHSFKVGATVASAAEHGEANEANENDPVAEDKELSARIKQEKSEGNDVSAAVAHQQKGEAAMKAGNTKDALEHFEQGERALAAGEAGEKGEKSGY
jgi:hypothetical protein